MEEFKVYSLLSDDIEEERLLRKELRKFNWGAFGFTWVWGCFNGIYSKTIFALILLVIGLLVPCLSGLCSAGVMGCAIYYGVYGNRWVYNEKKIHDIPKFINTQKKWACALLIAVILFIIISFVIGVFGALFVGKATPTSVRGGIMLNTTVNAIVKSDKYSSYKDGTDIAADVLGEPGKDDTNSEMLPYGATGVQFVYKSSGKPTHRAAMSFYKNGPCDLAKKNCYIYYYEALSEGDLVPVSKAYYDDRGEMKIVAIKQKNKK